MEDVLPQDEEESRTNRQHNCTACNDVTTCVYVCLYVCVIVHRVVKYSIRHRTHTMKGQTMNKRNNNSTKKRDDPALVDHFILAYMKTSKALRAIIEKPACFRTSIQTGKSSKGCQWIVSHGRPHQKKKHREERKQIHERVRKHPTANSTRTKPERAKRKLGGIKSNNFTIYC